jgi:hypothetical protein
LVIFRNRPDDEPAIDVLSPSIPALISEPAAEKQPENSSNQVGQEQQNESFFFSAPKKMPSCQFY